MKSIRNNLDDFFCYMQKIILWKVWCKNEDTMKTVSTVNELNIVIDEFKHS